MGRKNVYIPDGDTILEDAATACNKSLSETVRDAVRLMMALMPEKAMNEEHGHRMVTFHSPQPKGVLMSRHFFATELGSRREASGERREFTVFLTRFGQIAVTITQEGRDIELRFFDHIEEAKRHFPLDITTQVIALARQAVAGEVTGC